MDPGSQVAPFESRHFADKNSFLKEFKSSNSSLLFESFRSSFQIFSVFVFGSPIDWWPSL